MSIKLVLYRNSNRETEWNSHASGLGTMPCFQKTDTIRPFRDFSQDHPQARPGWCATLHACSSAAPPRASLAVRCSLAAPMSEPHRLPLAAPIIVVSTGLISDAHHSMRGSDIAGTDARQALGRFLPSGHLMVFCTSWSFWPHGLFPPRGHPPPTCTQRAWMCL